MNATAVAEAILATVCPTKFIIAAVLSALVDLFLYLTFPKFTAVASLGNSPIGPDTTSLSNKSTFSTLPRFASLLITSGLFSSLIRLHKPTIVPPPTPVPPA